jgi:hypothetical protein
VKEWQIELESAGLSFEALDRVPLSESISVETEDILGESF